MDEFALTWVVWFLLHTQMLPNAGCCAHTIYFVNTVSRLFLTAPMLPCTTHVKLHSQVQYLWLKYISTVTNNATGLIFHFTYCLVFCSIWLLQQNFHAVFLGELSCHIMCIICYKAHTILFLFFYVGCTAKKLCIIHGQILCRVENVGWIFLMYSKAFMIFQNLSLSVFILSAIFSLFVCSAEAGNLWMMHWKGCRRKGWKQS